MSQQIPQQQKYHFASVLISCVNPWILVIALGMICISSQCAAQDYIYQTGSPVFSVAQPGFLPSLMGNGVLDLANGNLHLEFPLASAPQRGHLPFELKLVYDSRIWQVVNVGGSLVWKPTNVPNSMGGWRVVSSADVGTVTNDAIFTACDVGQTYNEYNFVWHAPDGTQRKFPIQTAMDYGCGVDTPSGDALAIDSSGYHMYVTNYAEAVVYDRDGNRVFPTVQDTNGNHFSSDGSGNVVDTLGRTIVKVTTGTNQTFYDVLDTRGTTSRFTVTTQPLRVATGFNASQTGITDDEETITVIQSLELPTGDVYTFHYDEAGTGTPPTVGYGMLQSITGAIVQTYNYENFIDTFGVVNRWESDAQYGVTSCASGPCPQTASINGITYTFTMNGGAWNTGITAGDLQITNSFDFSQTCTGLMDNCSGPVYVRPISTRETRSAPTGPITNQITYGYDNPQYGNINLVKEWNFYQGGSFAAPPVTPDRQTVIVYNTDAGLTNRNIIDRPAKVTLCTGSGSDADCNGAGTRIQQTTYTYDSYGSHTCGTAGSGLLSIDGVTGHDDLNFGTSNTARGNVTAETDWAGGTRFLTSSVSYDTTGQVIQVTDPLGYSTCFSYTDNYFTDASSGVPSAFTPAEPTNAYPTAVKLPAGETLDVGYYFGTGQQAVLTDFNGQQTYQHFDDVLNRLTQAVSPKAWQILSYSSTLQNGFPVADIFSGIADVQPTTSCASCMHEQVTLDPNGHLFQSTLVSDPDGTISMGAGINFYGELVTATGPHRGASGGATVTNSYDVLHRITQVQNPDNSAEQIFYGANMAAAGGATAQLCAPSAYGYGYPVLTIDEIGHKKQVWRDAFSRIIEADEPDDSGTLSIATCYQYNIFGELSQVNQGSLSPRQYSYDSLARIKQVTTPEAGTTMYTYVNDDGTLCSSDAASVCKRVDARGVITRYTYDADGRLTQKTYSDGTPTATVNYGESAADPTTTLGTIPLTNTIGRPSSMFTRDANGVAITGEVFSYDAEGNVIDNSQCTPQNCIPQTSGSEAFRNTYTPDEMGNTVQFSNNWGRNIAAAVNNAGRGTSLTVSAPDTTHPSTIVSNVKYNAWGNVTSATLGNGLDEAIDYSTARNWIESVRVGSASAFSQTGGNVSSAGQGIITISGSLETTSSGAYPGIGQLHVTGGERTASVPGAQAGTATLVVDGLEQSSEIVEVPAVAGTADVTISGAAQGKAVAMPAVPAAGSFTLGGTLQRTAAVPAIPGTGSVTISGSEQSIPSVPATTASVNITIQGGERTFVDTSDCNLINHIWVCHTIYDRGTVYLTVNGIVGSCPYSQTYYTSSTAMASCLASAITGATGSPVTASTNSGSNIINVVARNAGAAGNYSFSVTSTWDTADFSGPAYTGTPASGNLSGGTDGIPAVYDSGACTVFINGTPYQQSFGQNDTSSTLATNLAGLITGGTLVNATASGTTISLTAKTGGAATNYPLSSSCSYDSTHFSSGSFAASPSGATLIGGKDAIPAIADSGTLTVTVNSTFNGSACYGSSGSCTVIDASCGTGDSTPSQLACLLASPNNPNGLNRAGSIVNATWPGGSSNILLLSSKTAGLNTNYAISSSSTYDAHFSTPSFTAARSGAALIGGNDASTRTSYDSGTVGLGIGNYAASASYAPLGSRSTWANRDLSPYTSAVASTMTAFLAGSSSAEHLFHLDGSSHIHETWLDAAGAWHDQDNTAATGAPAANSAVLTSFFSPNSTLPGHVYYTSGNHVHEQFSDSSGQWHDQDLTALAGAPATMTSTSLSSLLGAGASTENVFYEDANRHIHELYLASGVWHDEDDTALGGATALGGTLTTAGTSLVSFRTPDLSEHVLLLDTNHHVIEQHNGGGSWFPSDLTALTGAPPAATAAPQVGLVGFADPSSASYEHAFYIGSDYHIHHLWLDPSGWHHEDLMTLTGISSLANGQVSPLIGFLGNANSLLQVFYQNTGFIHHLWNDSSGWHDENISVLAGLDTTFQLTAGFLTGPGATLTLSPNSSARTFRLSSGNGSAAGMAAALLGDSNSGTNTTASPVNGTLDGATIHLVGKFGGTVSNYALTPSTTYDTTDFTAPSFVCNSCPSTMTGGVDPVVTTQYDSGTLSATINNHPDEVSWGKGSTSQAIATALADTINQDTAASVTANAAGNTLSFQAKTTGAATNYAFSAQVIHDTLDFDLPSFTVQASGSSLTGGSDTNGLIYDSGTITVTINGHVTSIPYGQGDTLSWCDTFNQNCTPGTLDTRLANAISSDPASPVWASLCCANGTYYSLPAIVIKLQSKKTGTSSNYPVVLTSATNNNHFTGSSYSIVLGYPYSGDACSASDTTLCYGRDSTTAAETDSGVITLSIGSFTGSIEYGTNPVADVYHNNPVPSTPPTIAVALAGMINQSPAAPVIAAVQDSTLQLIAKTGGSDTNYALSASIQNDDPAHFPSPSFTLSPGSGTLTGGSARPNPSASSASTGAVAFYTPGFTASPVSLMFPPCDSNYLGTPLSLVVNEHSYTICVSMSGLTTATPISLMAQTINSTPNSLLEATVVGNFLVLQSTTGGANANYFIDPVSCPPTPPLGYQSPCLDVSGPTMTGGSDASTGSSFAYGLDLSTDISGTVYSAADTVNGSWSYFYDTLDRLQQASSTATSYTYGYDRYGNRLHQTPLLGGNALSLVYLNNQIVATGITYDLSGNMTSDGNHNYAYDAENRLISVDGGQTATYTYGADGLRVRSMVGATFNDFIHDITGDTVGVLGANGALIRQEFGGIATYSDAAYFTHRDWLGNLRVVTDQTGMIRQTCNNLPFGDGLTCVGSTATPTYFTAYSRDPESGLGGLSGLDFANARYFTPQFGRFMSTDPLGGSPEDPQSFNPYAYASNNPLTFVDPSGMDDCPPEDDGCIVLTSGGGGSGSGGGGGGGGVAGVGGGPGIVFGCLFCFGNWLSGGSGPSLPGPPSAAALGHELNQLGLAMRLGVTKAVDANNRFWLSYANAFSNFGTDNANLWLWLGGSKMRLKALRADGPGAYTANALLLFAGPEGEGSATFVRSIARGETVKALTNEIARRTFETGLEHAIISMKNGERLMVAGSNGKIRFGAARGVRRIIIHTHNLASGPSADDFVMLEKLRQKSSWIYELFTGPWQSSGLTKFWRKGL